MRVHIVQALCPNRHCIFALAYEPSETHTPEAMIAKLKQTFDSAVAGNLINPRCAICHSTDITYEDGVSRFRSLAEATPDLQRLAREQAVTAAALKYRRASMN